VLNSDDFGCWEAALASSLGDHRSQLLSPSRQFRCCLRSSAIGPFSVLHIQGRGRLRLNREQQNQSVLWLPLQGLSEERINGQSWLAEPGTGLLFQQGDAMEGETSEEIEGISILIPPTLHRRPAAPAGPLLASGHLHRQLLSSARTMAAAAAQRPAGAEHAADAFTEALRAWTDWHGTPIPRLGITARRRREAVEGAQRWMLPRLAERFGVVELSQAIGISVRQLQYSFLAELGHSPMAEAKLMRLRRLRRLLLDPDQGDRRVAELIVAAGLIASGVTSADYRRWCGEKPIQTLRRRPKASAIQVR
jgi:AraC-like DNA-binding protein